MRFRCASCESRVDAETMPEEWVKIAFGKGGEGTHLQFEHGGAGYGISIDSPVYYCSVECMSRADFGLCLSDVFTFMGKWMREVDVAKPNQRNLFRSIGELEERCKHRPLTVTGLFNHKCGCPELDATRDISTDKVYLRRPIRIEGPKHDVNSRLREQIRWFHEQMKFVEVRSGDDGALTVSELRRLNLPRYEDNKVV